MKLLAYYIENYGKLSQIEGSFEAGLNCFCEANGSGKTTLASFIKAMFYGLPSYTVASKGFNDRQRFYPFGGGKFGGNITFESGGKIYKIERFFDKKSSKNDEMKVICGGAPYHGFSDAPGRELFGLDEESFQKTVFITADEIEIGSTHSINEKLYGTVEGEDDSNFEAAIDALDKAKKDLKAARGNNDKISRTKAEILEWTAKAHNIVSMSDSLYEEYVERDRLVKEIAVLETEVRVAGERDVLFQKWDTLDSMSKQAAEKETKWRAVAEKYPQGMPDEIERKRLHAYAQEETRLRGGLQMTAFSEEKERALEVLKNRFQNGIPSDLDIREMQAGIAQLSVLKAELAAEKTETTAKQRVLESKFSRGVPDEVELSQKRLLVEEYKRKDNEMRGVSAVIAQNTQPQSVKGKNKAFVALFVTAMALLGAGIGLLFVIQMVGIGLCAAAVLLGIVSLVIRGKSTISTDIPHSDVHLRLITLQSELRTLEEKIRAFTVPYGYYGEAGAVYDFNALEEDLQAYKEYQELLTHAQARQQKIYAEATELQQGIAAFLERYGETEPDLQVGLTHLIEAVQALRSLQADKQSSTAKTQDSVGRIEEIETDRKSILKKYGFDEFMGTMDGLSALESNARTIALLSKEHSDLTQSIAEYKQRHNLTERPKEEGVDTDEIHARLSHSRKELADCDKRIAEIERYVERLPEIENSLALAEERLKEYNEKYALLADTIEALKGAEQTLKDKYVAPIKDRFSIYAGALSRVIGEKIGMDKDFHIVFERGGEDRSERHLSAGERSLCALCLRLALVDNMYETEQPFIVMDDPFVHLDATHMAKTAELLKVLAKDKQILYFCCHESRRI